MSERTCVNNSVDNIMDTDAFEIHGMMFSIREVLQCVFLTNSSLYNQYKTDNSIIYIVNLKKELNTIMIATCVSAKLHLMKNSKLNTKTIQDEINTYMDKDGDGDYIMFLSKGYVTDNFLIQDSLYDFVSEENDSFIIMNADDIEELTNPNPVLK